MGRPWIYISPTVSWAAVDLYTTDGLLREVVRQLAQRTETGPRRHDKVAAHTREMMRPQAQAEKKMLGPGPEPGHLSQAERRCSGWSGGLGLHMLTATRQCIYLYCI